MQTARLSPRSFMLLLIFPATAHAMPEGAFLKHPVFSVAQLRRELNDASTVALYQKAFGTTKAEVEAQFGKLHLTRLSRDKVMRVYYQGKGKGWGYRTRRVQRGTQIFENRNGEPILIRVCGNPAKPVIEGDGGKNARIPDFSPQEHAASVIRSTPLQLADNHVAVPAFGDADLKVMLSQPEVAAVVPSLLLLNPEDLTAFPLAEEAPVDLLIPGTGGITGASPGFSLTRLGRLPLWIVGMGLPFLRGSSGGAGGIPGLVPPVNTGSGVLTPLPSTPIVPTGSLVPSVAIPEPGIGTLALVFALSLGILTSRRK